MERFHRIFSSKGYQFFLLAVALAFMAANIVAGNTLLTIFWAVLLAWSIWNLNRICTGRDPYYNEHHGKGSDHG
ncbi:hypothetical protein BJP40_06365 [Streptomyces sp. CC53]|uniref:hypothetical protein n=1 Tax=Streptomyces sp. CC53 TaxID=1906740 RepID=UPI0008DD5513|nr:hypothetical protein [Streptomyces sp. CC53]OII61146.1 hypothetical protein BJP40_06365 [Streptomyces sp. CC53]